MLLLELARDPVSTLCCVSRGALVPAVLVLAMSAAALLSNCAAVRWGASTAAAALLEAAGFSASLRWTPAGDCTTLLHAVSEELDTLGEPGLSDCAWLAASGTAPSAGFWASSVGAMPGSESKLHSLSSSCLRARYSFGLTTAKHRSSSSACSGSTALSYERTCLNLLCMAADGQCL